MIVLVAASFMTCR